jgi:hypothetical protein
VLTLSDPPESVALRSASCMYRSSRRYRSSGQSRVTFIPSFVAMSSAEFATAVLSGRGW